MTEGIDLPDWAAVLTAIFVLAGASLTLIGSLGLLRLEHFYQRLHAPTLGTTLGTGGILIGSMIFFSATGTRPILHEILIAVFITVTTPVTFILLVSAARRRGTDMPPSPSPEPAMSARISPEGSQHGRPNPPSW
jgi:multicomponent K+:H+ antiporter subunit G